MHFKKKNLNCPTIYMHSDITRDRMENKPEVKLTNTQIEIANFYKYIYSI